MCSPIFDTSDDAVAHLRTLSSPSSRFPCLPQPIRCGSTSPWKPIGNRQVSFSSVAAPHLSSHPSSSALDPIIAISASRPAATFLIDTRAFNQRLVLALTAPNPSPCASSALGAALARSPFPIPNGRNHAVDVCNESCLAWSVLQPHFVNHTTVRPLTRGVWDATLPST